MSPGVSPLGTLLATRLDAVLGTTLAQHPVLLEGMKPHHVAQAASALHPQDSIVRRPPDPTVQAGQRAVRREDPAAVGRQSANATQETPPAASTASARATLSDAAKLILALLVSRPAAPNPTSARPLLPLPPTLPSDADAPTARRLNAGASMPAEGASHAGTRGATSATAPNTASTTAPRSTPDSSAPAFARGAGANTATTAAAAVHSGTHHALVNGFAQALRQTLANSGMFYESHLAEMAFGRRGVEQLRQEPQALLSQHARGTAQAPRGGPPTPGANAPGQPAAPSGPGAAPSALAAPAYAASTPSANAAFAATTGAIASIAGGETQTLNIPGIHPDAAPLVRQQLEVLAQAMFSWQGEAWPGAPMQWQIGEEKQSGEAIEPDTWATELTLHLPRLGEVRARLNLAGEQMAIRLVAADSAAQLAEHGPVLRERFAALGLTLSDFAIMPHEPDA